MIVVVSRDDGEARMTAADGRLIMLSAGEASGDLHGATMCRALRALDPGLRLIGMGGPAWRRRVSRSSWTRRRTPRWGRTRPSAAFPGSTARTSSSFGVLREARPMAMVLIDFPEFNLRLAKQAQRARIPASTSSRRSSGPGDAGRIRQMARRVTRVLAAFPFEKGLYEGAGIPVEFVGHPLLDVVPSRPRSEESPGAARRGESRQTLVGLLPGSRRQEIERLLPPMLDAAALLSPARRPPLLRAWVGRERGARARRPPISGARPRRAARRWKWWKDSPTR